MAYKKSIDHIKYGAPGESKEVRTPDQQLENNIQYLKSLIDSALMGQALFYRDVTVDAATVVGTPVYWNNSTSQFEPALAAVVNDAATSSLVAAASSDVAGVVYSKTNATLADLLVLGVAPLDISAAVDGSVAAGRYYLSASEAGKLVAQAPDVSVPVLFNFGNGNVMVTPQMRDFLNDHVHFLFELTAEPAGDHTPPPSGGNHTITNPDSSKRGWLPANHSVFNGNAPTGAVFGYNLSAHDELERVWPPIPTSAVRMEIIRHRAGDDELAGLETTPPELVVFDQYGIWWMTDCYEQVPWPNETFPNTSSASSAALCPVVPAMRIYLSFLRMTYLNSKNVVTSLKSDSSAIEVVDCDGNPAETGDLHLVFKLNWAQVDSGELGEDVIKSFDDTTGELKRGKVLEGLIAGPNISLSSSTTRNLDPNDPSSALVYQGIATVSADTDPTGKEIPVELYRLDDARLRFTGSVPYIAFLEDQASSLVGKILLPSSALPTSPYLRLRVLFYGDATGTPPAITLQQLLVNRPASPTPLPSGQTAWGFDVPAVGAITSGDYFEVQSDALAFSAGDSLFFEMTRAGSDGYAGELGLLRVTAVLQDGP